MAGGIPLTNLTDLFRATSQAVLTPENFMIHEGMKRNSLLRKIMKSHDMMDMIQGGDTITDQIIFDEDSTASDYSPMETFTPALQNHLTEISIDWKFTQINVTFDKHEKGLNMASQLKKGARSMVFKRIIKAKWTNLFVSLNNHFERQFFATPNVTTMETSGGKVPLSLFCSMTDVLAASLAGVKPTGTVPVGFTTVQNVNPTTNTKWRNPVEGYAHGVLEIGGPLAAAGNPQRWDGFRAHRRLHERLKFEELSIRPEYGEVSDPEGFILCSLSGKDLWEVAQASLQDHTRHGADNASYGGLGTSVGLNFNGVPVCYIEMMDHAAVWKTAAAAAQNAGELTTSEDENGVALADPEISGPRYVTVVPKYWRKIVHSDHFLEEEAPPATVFQPFSRTIYYDNWHNNFNRSRQRAGGIVQPSVAIDL